MWGRFVQPMGLNGSVSRSRIPPLGDHRCCNMTLARVVVVVVVVVGGYGYRRQRDPTISLLVVGLGL